MLNPDVRLMDALSFTATDLIANQGGEITTAQQEVLRRKRTALLRRFMGLALFIACFNVPAWLIETHWDVVQIAAVAIFDAFILLLGSPLLVKRQKIALDLQNGIAQAIEGQVTLDIRVAFRGATAFSLTVNGVKFSIPKVVLLAFQNNERYRLYYVPESKVLVSAESTP